MLPDVRAMMSGPALGRREFCGGPLRLRREVEGGVGVPLDCRRSLLVSIS